MMLLLRYASCLGVVLAGLLASAQAADIERLDHGRFHNLTLYRPQGTPKSFVLFLSGDGGWNAATAAMARPLLAEGALVVGINTPRLLADLEQDGGDCVFPDGDLENLSHFVQAYARLPGYLPPLLVGYASGATLAYAMLAQAPPQTFAGALTLAFDPELNLRKPLCAGSGLAFTAHGDATGVDFLPAKTLAAPWITLHGEIDQASDLATTKSFVAQVSNAELVALPKVGHGFLTPANWLGPYLAAFRKLASTPLSNPLPAPPAGLGDLPIVELPATAGAPATDVLALILSGDGGWAGIDQDVAKALTARGIPVIGLDSLRYFWTARSPEGLAGDIDRILRYALAARHKSRAIVIGYSQGADVLPFALNRLPAAIRPQVAEAAVMGLSADALFEFHLASWVDAADKGLPTQPEIERLARVTGGMPVLCVYGEDDDEAICPKLDRQQVTIVKLKGGHHFGGDYDAVAQVLIAHIPPLGKTDSRQGSTR